MPAERYPRQPPNYHSPSGRTRPWRPYPEEPRQAGGGYPAEKTTPLEAVLSFVGALPQNVAKGLLASLSFLGSLPRSMSRIVTASLQPTGGLRRTIEQFKASLPFQGIVGRNIQYGLTAVLGYIEYGAVLGMDLLGAFQLGGLGAARSGLEGTLRKEFNIAKKLEGLLSFHGKIARFPTTMIVDTFKRANENPLSNGEKWTLITGYTNRGQIEAEHWTGVGTPFLTSGARWNVKEPTIQATSVEHRGGSYDLWTCLSPSAGSGYMLTVLKTVGSELILKRVTEGVTTILAETSIAIEVGDLVGITASGGYVSGWIQHAGKWKLVLEVADATYTSGYSGIAGRLVNVPEVNNFAIGDTLFSHTVTAALSFLGLVSRTVTRSLLATLFKVISSTITILDTFERAAESPLSNGGKWTKLGWTKTAGRVFSAASGWTPKEGGENAPESEADGAYWNVQEFLEPTVSVHILSEEWSDYVALWACTTGKGEKNGYRLQIRGLKTLFKFNLILEKWENGVRTELAKRQVQFTNAGKENTVQMTVSKGIVQIWFGTTEAGLTGLNEAVDSTFTQGYVGIEGTNKVAYGETKFRAGGATIPMTTLGHNTAHGILAKLEPIGVLKKVFSLIKKLAGTLEPTATMTRSIRHGLAGTLTFLGSLVPHEFTGIVIQKIEASLSFLGTVPRFISRVLTASLSFLGGLPRNVLHRLSANLSFVGTLSRSLTHGLNAALSFAGTLPRSILRQLTAGLTFLGTLPRRIARTLTGTLSFLGTLPRALSRALTASLAFAGQLTKVFNIAKRLIASLEFAALVNFSGFVVHRMQASISFSTVLSRRILRGLVANLSFVGSLPSRTVHRLTATLTFLGSISTRTAHALTASLSFLGTLGHSIAHRLTGSLSFLGALRLEFNLRKTLTASLAFTGTLTKVFALVKRLIATLNFGGFIRFSGEFIHRITASLTFARSLPSNITHTLGATLSFLGLVQHRISRVLIGVLDFTGHLARGAARQVLTATLDFVGHLQASKYFTRRFQATLSFLGTLARGAEFDAFFRFAFGPDQLVLKLPKADLTLIDLQAEAHLDDPRFELIETVDQVALVMYDRILNKTTVNASFDPQDDD